MIQKIYYYKNMYSQDWRVYLLVGLGRTEK